MTANFVCKLSCGAIETLWILLVAHATYACHSTPSNNGESIQQFPSPIPSIPSDTVGDRLASSPTVN